MPIKLVVGLGNPGKSYAATRHNIGRRVVEHLEKKGVDGVMLYTTDVYMNESGIPVSQLLRKKGWQPEDVLVISDDFELPLGRLRIRAKGSSGGHNGLKSLFEHLGTQAIPRVRVGIGPVPEGVDPAEYVLKAFHSAEKRHVERVIEEAGEAVRVILSDGLETAMNQFNKAPDA